MRQKQMETNSQTPTSTLMWTMTKTREIISDVLRPRQVRDKKSFANPSFLDTGFNTEVLVHQQNITYRSFIRPQVRNKRVFQHHISMPQT